MQTTVTVADAGREHAIIAVKLGEVYLNPYGLVLSVVMSGGAVAGVVMLVTQHGRYIAPGSAELAHMGPLRRLHPPVVPEPVTAGSPSDLDGPPATLPGPSSVWTIPTQPPFPAEAAYWTDDADGDPVLPILDSGGYLPCGCLGSASEHACNDRLDAERDDDPAELPVYVITLAPPPGGRVFPVEVQGPPS